MIKRGCITLAILVFHTLHASAQEGDKRFGFELGAGPSFATSKLHDASPNTGFGFEGIFHYRFMKHLGVYAGWGWNRFAVPATFAGQDADFEETGYVFGLQFKHPIGDGPVSWYLRGGGLYNHVEVENSDGDITHDSGHGLGWQLAGGVDVALGRNWSLTPGVKFNSLSTEVDLEGEKIELDYHYLTVRVGILKRF